MAITTSTTKILNLAELTRQSRNWRQQGRRLVLTNGAFDILHLGHVRYLETARSMGDVLVVGVNDDASVRRLKGPSRPLNLDMDRAAVVGALQAVDRVVIFSSDTASELVEAAQPNIYVKGGDYSADPNDERHPVEGPLVRRLGGTVHILEFVPGRSTTALVARLQATVS